MEQQRLSVLRPKLKAERPVLFYPVFVDVNRRVKRVLILRTALRQRRLFAILLARAVVKLYGQRLRSHLQQAGGTHAIIALMPGGVLIIRPVAGYVLVPARAAVKQLMHRVAVKHRQHHARFYVVFYKYGVLKNRLVQHQRVQQRDHRVLRRRAALPLAYVADIWPVLLAFALARSYNARGVNHSVALLQLAVLTVKVGGKFLQPAGQFEPRQSVLGGEVKGPGRHLPGGLLSRLYI